MAAGQGAFWVASDEAALSELEVRLSVHEADRGAAHARLLRTVLELNAVHAAQGLGFSTVPHLALVLGCSEHRAGTLLRDALGLVELPGALEAVQCGLLTVEQGSTVVEQLAVLPFEARLTVWRWLQTRLIADEAPLPPARLAELLRRWVVAADPADAVARRQRAEQGRRVDYRRRSDGLGDLFGTGFRGPDLQAILSRIRARSAPWGADDDRTADQRRFDAFRDILLGREQTTLLHRGCSSGGEMPAAADPSAAGQAAHGATAAGVGAPCGCMSGSPVPCGAELVVHVPLGAALGTTDEVADLVGAGPLEPDLLQDLLLAAARVRPVWVDGAGNVVAASATVVTLERGDPASVREALLRLAALPPPPAQPRHPGDHAHRPAPRHQPEQPPSGASAWRAPAPGDAALCSPSPGLHDGASTLSCPSPGLHDGTSTLSCPSPGLHDGTSTHPPGTAGAYRPPRWLRRLIAFRAPRCEWPGCGARAVRCDAEHDLAWPDGPTCACNLGPCCRRHHRIKQTGWTKTRTAHGLRWTSPTSRNWRSAAQHQPPAAAPVRPLPPVPSSTPDPLVELSPLHLEHELAQLGLLPDDPGSDLVPSDADVPDSDRLGQRLTNGDTRWTLDLDDPYAWLDEGISSSR